MRKFLILLNKEINELLTIQTIIPLIIMVLIFMFIGNVIGKESKKSQSKPSKIYIIDFDKSNMSKGYIQFLKDNNVKVLDYMKLATLQKKEITDTLNYIIKGESDNKKIIEIFNDFVNDAKKNDIDTALFIPPEFEKQILNGKKINVYPFSILTNFSIIKLSSSKSLNLITSLLKIYIEDIILTKIENNIKKVYSKDFIKTPININYSLYVNKKIANIHPAVIGGFIISQTIIIPIVIFMVIIFSIQMVATAIASEKENKTLETLLSMPITRSNIVSAKMLGAGIVSIIMALIYIIGFRYYLNGLTGGNISSEAINSLKPILNKLGLTLNFSNLLILGISIFGSILNALAIALILGAFASDVKQVQAIITPIIVFVMIPYIISIFIDINSLSPGLRYLIYSIPFSHPFFATTNIYFGNLKPVFYGIGYEFFTFFILVIIASKIFSSDKILTMKLNLKKSK